jgi:hypothetical protein
MTPGGTQFPISTATPTSTITPTPTATGTAGPTPTATRMPSPLVYSDNFSNPASGWITGISGVCQREYVGGTYAIAVTYDPDVNTCWSTPPSGPQIDGTFAVTANKQSATDGSIYGIVFGMDNPSNATQFYVFWVDPYDQTYMLKRYNNGIWSDLSDVWPTSTAINADAGSNTLKVRRQGDQITIYVNGVDLATVTDNSFPTNGYVGIVNWSVYNYDPAVTFFDDFSISQETVILNDTFSNSRSGWPVGSIEVCQADYVGGEYETISSPNTICGFRGPTGAHPDGIFAVMARREESVYPTNYGLFFAGAADFSSLYALLVAPDSQEYVLAIYNGAGWSAVNSGWTSSADINAGSAANKLTVVRDGTRMDLYINDLFQETVYDATLIGNGYYGVINWASPNAPVASFFDDFTLTVWDAPQPLVAAQEAGQAEMRALSTERATPLQPAPVAPTPTPKRLPAPEKALRHPQMGQ